MAFLKIFRVPKHQKYDYKPRFWNPQKEALDDRLAQIEAMKNGGIEATKSRISGGFKRGYAANYKAKRKQVFKSNMMLMGIIVLLLIASYLLISKYLPMIATSLEGGS